VRAASVRCTACALRYPRRDGVYLLGPPFAVNVAGRTFATDRMRRLAADAHAVGWDAARQRFAAEVLAGTLRAPEQSRWARLRAKVTGTTWEDTLQDLVDPTRAGWKFLLNLRSTAWVLFLGPSWGAAPVSLARSAAHVVVLDGSVERLRLVREHAAAAGLENLTFARVVDPLRLPLPDGSVNLVVAPGLVEWFTAVAGERVLSAACGRELLGELRRVLAPRGQAYVATDNRTGLTRLLGARRASGASFSARGLREAAAAAGFRGSRVVAPIPFQHKFHQVLELEPSSPVRLSADPYRTRGRLVRPLVKAWDVCNRNGALERRLHPLLPSLGAVLSTEPEIPSLAERLLEHLAAGGQIAHGCELTRYFVRAKGAAVLVASAPDGDGVIVRLPLDERAEAACAAHHQALETLVSDLRSPEELRRLFPAPYARGSLEGQPFFAESAVPGEAGRIYYSRGTRRYDRAILNAAEVLRQLRRATERPVPVDGNEFARLCGRWLEELRGIVGREPRVALDAIERRLERTLVGRTLPLGWHHGDYDFANLLYGPRDAVTGILDFEVFDARGLPLIDLMVLVARRPIRRTGFAFGTLFARSILARKLPPLEARLLEEEMRTVGADEELYQALALCCWLDHLRLRRDSWLVRSPSWLDQNLHEVVEAVRRIL